MDNEKIEKYLDENIKFNMPDFQEYLSMPYSQTNKILEELQSNSVIKFCGGFTYEVVRRKEKCNQAVYEPKNAEESVFIKALWECIVNNRVSQGLIQRRCLCSYTMAMRAIDWMHENDYVGPYPERKVKISAEEYLKKFGSVENSESENSENVLRGSRRRNRPFLDRLGYMPNYFDDDDDTDDDDEDDDEDDDADDYDEFDEKSRREFLEKRRESLIARLRQSYNDDNEKDDKKTDCKADFKPILVECLERGLQDKSNQQKYILNLDGKSQFDLEFVNEGSSLKISDGGKTLGQVLQSKRRIKNVLKGYSPVALIGEEISITIENPSDALIALLTLYSAIDAVKKMK